MTQYTFIDEQVITFADNTSDNIEEISENLNVKYLPPQGMSRASQILPFLPFGTSTLWAWSRDGRFPSPIRLSNTMTAWRNADVIEWLSSQNIPKKTPTSEGV